MIHLSTNELKLLLSLLEQVPELGESRGRAQILDLAGLRRFIPLVDLSGPTRSVAHDMVRRLVSFGRVNDNQEALGMLLDAIKGLVGLEQQQALDGLMAGHDMGSRHTLNGPASAAIDTEQSTSLSREKRLEVLGEQLLGPQFEEILYLLMAPHSHLPSSNVPQMTRAIQLLFWAEANNKLDTLDELIARALPHLRHGEPRRP